MRAHVTIDQQSRHVVLVDTYGPSSARLARGFQDAGYVPIQVQSTPEIPPLGRGREESFAYGAKVVHHGDLTETLRALSPFRPVAVIPGCEPGVELADALSAALQPITGAPTNGTALSAARRDKFAMIERIKEAGLRGAEQILVDSEDQLRAWHTKLGRMAIVKPRRSYANDGVAWCRTPSESVDAFRRLGATDDELFEHRGGVVAQEYLIGSEYLVNTVSRDGIHHVCDIWKTHRMSANGIDDLCVACQILPRAGQLQDELVQYAFDVLDALDIRHGGGHVEIKMTPDGPCLVEVGARIAGADLPGYTQLATGESQVDWLVDAYLRPERFKQRAGRPYELHRSVAWALMVAPRSGVLVSYRGLDAIRGLESFRDMRLLVQPGQRLARTIDDSTYPVMVSLMHEVDDVLLRDLWTLRYIDGDGFYELADDVIQPNSNRDPAGAELSLIGR